MCTFVQGYITTEDWQSNFFGNDQGYEQGETSFLFCDFFLFMEVCLNLHKLTVCYKAVTEKNIGAMKKGTRGALGPLNKEQNWENKEQNGGKKLQNGTFLGCGNSWKYLL